MIANDTEYQKAEEEIRVLEKRLERLQADHPIGSKGFLRESSKFFTHPPTRPEIDAALHALSQGRNK